MIAAKRDAKGTHAGNVAKPRLSVVLLSSGSQDDLERALLAVTDPASDMGAQVVVVRETTTGVDEPSIQRLAQQYRCGLAMVPMGSTRSTLSDAAMGLVTGDIVAFREDVRAQSGDWLAVFGRSMGITEAYGLESRAEVVLEPTITDERPMPRASQAWRRLEVAAESVG